MRKEEVAKKLKHARLACGMTQKSVAERLGRSVALIGHWETGYSQPDADTIATLLRLYGVDANDFFEVEAGTFMISAPDEIQLIKAYRGMEEQDRKAILRFVRIVSSATLDPIDEERRSAEGYLEWLADSQSEDSEAAK